MPQPTRVLLVDDDEDDYVLARDSLASTVHGAIKLDWMSTLDSALAALSQNDYDACVVDYRLGVRNGTELIRAARSQQIDIPFILMTGVGNADTDQEAMQAGADDYLEKAQATGPLLERSIRYAIKHKAAERELAIVIENFRTLAENSMNLIARVDKQLCLSYMNAAMETYTHLDNIQYRGTSLEDFPPNSLINREWVELVKEALTTDLPTDGVLVVRGADDSRIIHWRIVPERDTAGHTVSLLCTGHDVTLERQNEAEKRRLERELEQARRFEALGRMAGGLAHDFNNLLTVINGYAAIVMDSLAPQNPLYGDVQEILQAGQEGAALISKLLSFSQHAMTDTTAIDIGKVVAEAIGSIQIGMEDNIAIRTSLSDTPPCSCAGESMMRRILAGIITNSIEAIQAKCIGDGFIDIHTWLHTQSQEPDELHLNPGRYVALAITDNGIGMDHETLSRVFEPFFTQKTRTRGTGLTLAVAYGAIRQCHGNIAVHSQAGQGTTITLYLPAVGEWDEQG